MDFGDFKNKVENWANVRGIYDHSSESHQQAKALEEVGEFITAKTKNDMVDAIGDIAVCVVNAAHFSGDLNKSPNLYRYRSDMGAVANSICIQDYNHVVGSLVAIASSIGVTFATCLQAAWDEIKDRKGMMVDGKYVKWDNLTPEQREEFLKRDHSNTLLRHD